MSEDTMNRENLVNIEDCHKCLHFEKEKTKDDGKKVVMCKFCIDEKVDPFEIQWAPVYSEGVECTMKKYRNMTF
jgi:Zn ribbon nucleic-acid-binding protein